MVGAVVDTVVGVVDAVVVAGVEALSASLLFALGALGAVEHIFFALPFRDGALWGWALPSRTNRINA